MPPARAPTHNHSNRVVDLDKSAVRDCNKTPPAITVMAVFASGSASAIPQQAAPASATPTMSWVDRPRGLSLFFSRNSAIAIARLELTRKTAALPMASGHCQNESASRGVATGTRAGLLDGIDFTYSGRGPVESDSVGSDAASV